MNDKDVNDVKVLVLSLLTALAEAGSTGAPNGVLYAAVMGRYNLTTFNAAKILLERAGFATEAGDVTRLTDLGFKKAAEVEAMMKTTLQPS